MTSLLNKTQCQVVKRAWQAFNTVINTLPSSDTTALLIFHATNLLDKLDNPPVEQDYIEIITRRVTLLAKTSTLWLDIDDMLKGLQDAARWTPLD